MPQVNRSGRRGKGPEIVNPKIPSDKNFDSGSAAATDFLAADGDTGTEFRQPKAGDIDVEGATEGQVVTADGNESATWADPAKDSLTETASAIHTTAPVDTWNSWDISAEVDAAARIAFIIASCGGSTGGEQVGVRAGGSALSERKTPGTVKPINIIFPVNVEDSKTIEVFSGHSDNGFRVVGYI